MKIAIEKPPNYALIVARFPTAVKKGVLFCWGDTIFNPTNVDVPNHLVEHETVHSKRQGANPEIWWDSYINNDAMRFQEELLAHQREYQVVMSTLSRHDRRAAEKIIAERLASPLYGNMVNVKEARKLIKETQCSNFSSD